MEEKLSFVTLPIFFSTLPALLHVMYKDMNNDSRGTALSLSPFVLIGCLSSSVVSGSELETTTFAGVSSRASSSSLDLLLIERVQPLERDVSGIRLTMVL